MNDSQKVSTGKPKVGGAIFRAPLGTALPKDAKSELNVAFKGLGYISDEGVTNTNSPETNDTKAWGGDIVLSSQTAKKDTFKYTLIEALNENALKAVYGEDNVTVSDSMTKIVATSDEQEEAAWVVEMIMKGGKLKRIVIPCAKITQIGDIVYKDDEAVAYPLTITATPYTDGDETGTHWEYIE